MFTVSQWAFIRKGRKHGHADNRRDLASEF